MTTVSEIKTKLEKNTISVVVSHMSIFGDHHLLKDGKKFETNKDHEKSKIHIKKMDFYSCFKGIIPHGNLLRKKSSAESLFHTSSLVDFGEETQKKQR